MLVTPIANKTDLPEIHRAGWIVIDSDNQIKDGFVKIINDEIIEVGKWVNKPDATVIDHGPGLIFPSLINAHTHLELSALKGVLIFDKSFKSWVKELLYHRENTTKKELSFGYKNGISELIASGCFVAGEITTLGDFEEDFKLSDIEGVYFNEYLGGIKNRPEENLFKDSFIKSFAGHAPHTTSPDLLKYLKQRCRKVNLPFSIHLSESEEEDEFIKTGKGEWADFLRQRGIDFSSWPVTENGSVAYLDALGILDDKTIAVHLIRADQKDYSVLKDSNVSVCLCPRSNQNLHGRLPDAVAMFNKNINLCLGTDSLASTQSLSIIDEICVMNKEYPEISPREIFRMATINGAKALGVSDRFGTIATGKSGKCFYLPVDVEKDSDVYTSFMRYK